MKMQRFKVPRACRDGYLTDRLYCLGAAFTKKDLPVPSLFFIKGGDFGWELHKLPFVPF